MSPQSSHRPAKRLDLHIVDLYQLDLSARIVRKFFVYAFAGVLREKNSFKYQNSPTHFHLPLFLEFFWGNLTKVGQNYKNNKFAQSGRILPKIANNSRHAWRLSRLLKPQINRTMGPHGVNDDGSIFPGKSNPLQTCSFLSRLLSGALSRTTQ